MCQMKTQNNISFKKEKIKRETEKVKFMENN